MLHRLHLTRPLEGTFRDQKVRVLHVSASEALVEQNAPFAPGTEGRLRFTWRDQTVEIAGRVERNVDSEMTLRFTEHHELLERLIAESAAEVLRAQQANMAGNRENNVVGDETLTAASVGLGRGYITWTLSEYGWKKRRSLLPDQPENGFTVAANESAEQVEMLRKTWENGDEEARRMTRKLAALSAASVRSK